MRTRDINKEEIVKQKAIEMIVKQGVEGFGMNRLAKECGVSVATLYIYYSDKEDLIRKIGIEIGSNLFNKMLNGFSPEMSFKDGLRNQWENRIDFLLNFTLEATCFELLKHSTYGDAILAEITGEFKQTMSQFMLSSIEKKELVPVTFEVFWSIAYGSLYSLLELHREGKSMSGKSFVLNDDLKNETFNLVLKALTP
ncbi:TetR family transcriptional regulator [Flavobacterium sp. Root935]|jgi:TetR/AcrR family transcriptional repressor of multidrug resistance operon|uniref:TetR/AcrR family transcriptional regulator n=1 Tax=unclassified Flavobacterium TaxID=196869 RepID=UPI00070B33E7|nr:MULTISPECIES: TetR/AcrR family transcriptional regulator [unclassified Flavobacterium]KRD58558.1 TetR family transcriptional regulator [Flavobacterium sp. Root935]MDQ1164806.1 TetR/AcrR family transcriptional repressor of multidrug resistance operon [Flavobacterium sp. SORGH_AS_0622]TDX11403.1 TetR family transcriptional regulator [Flavobacterium sp. S87F.05.LMB.W.Kidney.N]